MYTGHTRWERSPKGQSTHSVWPVMARTPNGGLERGTLAAMTMRPVAAIPGRLMNFFINYLHMKSPIGAQTSHASRYTRSLTIIRPVDLSPSIPASACIVKISAFKAITMIQLHANHGHLRKSLGKISLISRIPRFLPSTITPAPWGQKEKLARLFAGRVGLKINYVADRLAIADGISHRNALNAVKDSRGIAKLWIEILQIGISHLEACRGHAALCAGIGKDRQTEREHCGDESRKKTCDFHGMIYFCVIVYPRTPDLPGLKAGQTVSKFNQTMWLLSPPPLLPPSSGGKSGVKSVVSSATLKVEVEVVLLARALVETTKPNERAAARARISVVFIELSERRQDISPLRGLPWAPWKSGREDFP